VLGGNQEVASAICVRQRDTEHHRTDLSEEVIDLAGEVPAPKRRIAIQDFLQDLGAGTAFNVSSLNLP
jgi:hypothetical protein